MPIDEKRLAELKQQALARIAGETKVSTERHAIYKFDVDVSTDTPRMIIHSRQEVTAPSGTMIPGESIQTIAPLARDSPPFSKVSLRGLPIGEMQTVGDMVESALGFAVNALADRFAREAAEKEAAENPPEDKMNPD